MVLFDQHGVIKRYETAEDILKEFFKLRMDYYNKRRLNLIKARCFGPVRPASCGTCQTHAHAASYTQHALGMGVCMVEDLLNVESSSSPFHFGMQSHPLKAMLIPWNIYLTNYSLLTCWAPDEDHWFLSINMPKLNACAGCGVPNEAAGQPDALHSGGGEQRARHQQPQESRHRGRARIAGLRQDARQQEGKRACTSSCPYALPRCDASCLSGSVLAVQRDSDRAVWQWLQAAVVASLDETSEAAEEAIVEVKVNYDYLLSMPINSLTLEKVRHHAPVPVQ
jgi:hypothetical protein